VKQRLALHVAPLLVLACQRQVVAPVSVAAPTQQARASTAKPLLLRTIELDPDAQDRALAPLGYVIDWHDQAPIPVTDLPFRDIVAFTVSGADYCRAITPEPDLDECEPTSGIDGHYAGAGEHLGFAILSFSDPKHAELEHVRLFEEAPFGQELQLGTLYLSKSEPIDFRPERPKSFGSRNREHHLESMSVADVDGDGRQEIVAVLAVEEFAIVEYYYGECADIDCPDLADPDAFASTAYEGRRLLILRDNLTVQLDVSLDELGFTVFDGWNPYSDDRINHSFALEHSSVVAQWCELDFGLHTLLSGCEVELACASPTVRVRWHYAPESDAYATAQLERLRPRVDDHGDEWSQLCPQ
jgi:hypothetical protein